MDTSSLAVENMTRLLEALKAKRIENANKTKYVSNAAKQQYFLAWTEAILFAERLVLKCLEDTKNERVFKTS